MMKRMILIDGNSLMYKAYFGTAYGNQMKTSKGIYTNATYAFANMINSLCNSEYDAILVAFDAGKKTFRHEFMDDYKAGRNPMPDEMRMQIAYIKQFLDLKRIKRYEVPLYEADDIIGTMAKMAEDSGYHVDIYSGDKDLLQLITNNTTVHITKKGVTDLEDYTPESFLEKYEIPVSSFVDLKALMGDTSDHYPGVPGIGEKKGIKYLKTYLHVEDILANVDDIKGSDHDKFINYGEQALLCKKMATILREAPIEINVSDTIKKSEDEVNLYQFYEELEFKSFLKPIKKEIKKVSYEILNEDNIKDYLLEGSAIICENSDYNYHKYPILAIGLSNELGNFIIEQKLFTNPYFKDFIENTPKVCYDLKRIYVSLKHFNLNLANVNFDLYLATYILRSDITKYDFKDVINYYYQKDILAEDKNDVLSSEEIYGKGAKRKIPELDILYNYIASKSAKVYQLINKSKNELIKVDGLNLLTDIDIPLSYILGDMEYNGMMVSTSELEKMDKDLEVRINSLEQEIYELAGKSFNISSPKQLASILFTDLNIPYPSDSKKGYKTDAETLSKIETLHPIVNKVLDYRQLTKLYTTYINGLREQIFPDGKVHTIFEQALTETGRLSSVEPNLQNIPIRTEEGRLIRKLFIPSNIENKMYSADYSQIELRVLASVADVKHLIEAFNNNEDIHTSTAKKIFGHDDITSLERRKAKAVNFGIVYGISPFGLAKDINTTQKEAKEFINKYYEINPEVKEYMNNIISECKENGYVETLFKRRRYILEVNSSNHTIREIGKRMAMNAPIQGAASDIIKIAMIKISKALKEEKLKSKMLVQVHDELVFEVYPNEEEKLQELVKKHMINAYKLQVPLEVADGFGNNWYELK